MSAYVGGGWRIHHLTDRVVELRKDDYGYRRFTGRDGFVLMRGEPGMSRAEIVAKAVVMAQRNDEALALRIGKRLAPSLQSLADYTGKSVRVTQAFRTPEDADRIGVKHVG